MIDLHSHLLPAVDDGAVDLAEAVAMCRLAAADGCTAMVATPHLRHEQGWNGDRGRLEELWRRVGAAVRGEIEVFLGGEIAVNSQSLAELDDLPDGDLLPLTGSRYLLLEFHPRIGPDPEEVVYELAVRGWVPVIAHPERIRWLAEDPGYLGALLAHGALTQVTAISVTGELGRYAQNAAQRMLGAGMVHFVASDAHDTRLRPPGLGAAYRYIAEHWGEATAHRLCVIHPQAVLENRPLRQASEGPTEAPAVEALRSLQTPSAERISRGPQ